VPLIFLFIGFFYVKDYNLNGKTKINTSLLLIDDESDNASVNTNKPDEDPAVINSQIKELLNVFTKASYVGFTATPFANIFIDPDTNDEMLKEDLFPKDYIYSLDAPSNYIGARNIFSDAGKHTDMLVKINGKDMEKCLPSNHKGDYVVTYIPDDLKQAINSFLIANVIRDLRGDINKHRSMLINISRFTNVQEIIEMEPVLKAYIQEAIEVDKTGLKVEKKNPELTIPEELQNMFAEVPELKTAFEALTPGRQRAYVLYFSQPKQSKTREARIEKYMQQILDGKGLND
jgi:hypothetical protein